MTEHVLILGDAQDPMVPQWQNYCEAAGILTTLYLDRETDEPPRRPDVPYSVVLNTHIEIPFFYLEHLPDQFYNELADDCLCLVNCLSETPTSIAAATELEDHVVGFSALPLYVERPVIEIARAMQTDSRFMQRSHHFLGLLGIRAIEVPESPALVLGRVLAMLVNEATSALMEGVATPNDIDVAMQLGTNYPLGPLAWADRVGLDVVLSMLDHLFDEFGDPRYCPMTLLKQKVAAGKLGRKSGEGFYSYHPESMMR